jgi:activator of 2-hydroxyglutaryl-CoA dehydratase
MAARQRGAARTLKLKNQENEEEMTWIAGVDVGGTFTDIVLFNT